MINTTEPHVKSDMMCDEQLIIDKQEKLYWYIYSGGKRTNDQAAKRVADHSALARDWNNLLLSADNVPMCCGKYWVVCVDDNGDGVLVFADYDTATKTFDAHNDYHVCGWTAFKCHCVK